MEQILNRKRYSTDAAERIADNEFRDGANRLQGGRGSTLYRTKSGAYFLHRETQWTGESDRIEPIDVSEAIEVYEMAYHHDVEYESAFPDVQVVDA